ncbi:MAG: UDP-glucuronate decarboxylase [Myxococcota bacterium]
MARVLVTGGAGFVGSHLCTRLVEDGHIVRSVDNYHTGRAANLAHLDGHPRFTAEAHDVVHPLDCEVDRIYHLACPASPVHYQRDPVRTVETNVLGALTVLRLAERTGARVLLASTSEVYGDPEVHPQPEGYAGRVNPIGPRACYDEGKRVAETLFFDMHRTRGVAIRVARIFNTYGPRMALDDGRVVCSFAAAALRGEPLVLFGDGEQTRSFCYVDDLVEGLVRLMESEHLGPVNLGNPHEITVRRLAEAVIEQTGSRSPLTHGPLPEDDPARRQPDIARAREWLAWSPGVGLDEGLRRTVAWCRSELAAAPAHDGEAPAAVPIRNR